MAYDPNELFSSTTRNSSKRVFPTKVYAKTLAPASGGPLVAKGTPLAFDTSINKWVVWDNGGSNSANLIKGFLWPDDVTLDDTNDVIANVMMEGQIDYNDVVLPSGQTDANLKAALRSGPRESGLWIEGLDQVH